MQWAAFIFIVCILIIRGIWPGLFNLDKFSMGLLFLLAIPLLAPYLKKAKWFGAEFVFRDEIKKLDAIVQKSEQQAKEAEEQGKAHIGIFETFSTINALNLIDSDPNLSLAALRIEIEKVLSKTVSNLCDIHQDRKVGNRFYISKLLEEEIISYEQGKALQTIVNMCNKAIHGAQVSSEEAREIILITERLNKSFSTGYSINFEENKDYAKQGLLCEYEHCIENFHISEEPTELSCLVFGHDCPGGTETLNSCNKTIDDIPKKRFIKKV
jgi:hypothetical protein